MIGRSNLTAGEAVQIVEQTADATYPTPEAREAALRTTLRRLASMDADQLALAASALGVPVRAELTGSRVAWAAQHRIRMYLRGRLAA